MAKELTLRVAESHHRDVGRDIARIEREKMELLGLVSGDYIEIVGKDTTYAIVWPAYPEDRGNDLIRIDGNIRNNAGTSLDDKVKIKKAEAKEAKRVTLAPTQAIRLVGGAQYIHRLLEGRPINKGQQIRVETVSNPLNFVVLSTSPNGPVFVGKSTAINLKDEIVDESKLKGSPKTT
ncbi:MAG: ATPase, partial [Methanosarcinales archaeon]|nr:ATPase [Methanosarcinales archaeon]